MDLVFLGIIVEVFSVSGKVHIEGLLHFDREKVGTPDSGDSSRVL